MHSDSRDQSCKCSPRRRLLLAQNKGKVAFLVTHCESSTPDAEPLDVTDLDAMRQLQDDVLVTVGPQLRRLSMENNEISLYVHIAVFSIVTKNLNNLEKRTNLKNMYN